MTILAIDIGTTHCKAGLFKNDGSALKLASRAIKFRQSPGGWAYIDPAEVIRIIIELIKEIMECQYDPVAAVGVASMAETGILLDLASGTPCTHFIPWFDTTSQISADYVRSKSDPVECYQKFGLKATFKTSLAKILWLRDVQNLSMDHKVWLSAADYVVYWLTGEYRTDVSLASRTFAYRVDRKEWDGDWLRGWGLPENIFPPAVASGKFVGGVSNSSSGLPTGIPVSICGHDHVCAALAMGAIRPGTTFDSMGTAETLIGALPERSLTQEDYENGLLYGCHTVNGMGYWLGGLSASGGSVEWLRGLQGSASLSYDDLESMSATLSPSPSGILYFPYLLGSGSPHTHPSVRGAFIGLSARHTIGDLYQAILEGTAYELELIRRAGEKMTGQSIDTLIAAGGGTRNRPWMQIKADVTGCNIHAATEPEATLLGAALLAGIGNGIYESVDDALAYIAPKQGLEVFVPNPENHRQYKNLFENGYLTLQQPLRQFGSWAQQQS